MKVLVARTPHEFTEDLLDQHLGPANLPASDRGLCMELVYGVVRWQQTLDWLISQKTAARPQKYALQTILRLGLYQLFWLDRVPDHAAVNETVELARQSGFGPQSGFVNALLRGYLREKDATKNRLAELKKSQPAIGYSHPDWLTQRWCQRWDPNTAVRLLEWNNSPPKTYARANLLKGDPGTLLELWREENVEYDFVRAPWFGENLVFQLKSHPSLVKLASFQEGWFYIQDPSTLLAVEKLQPRPGQLILDLCAAPGGKLTYIAQLMNNEGRLFAYDSNPNRLKLVEQNCSRLKVTCVEIAETIQSSVAVARHPKVLPAAVSAFDGILIDAPCSNTGVMRRRIDLRWRIRPEEVASLGETQLDLLRTAAGLLKPGGALVYSTCSLEPEENSLLIGRFLDEFPGWRLKEEQDLLPFRDGFDGAYVAKLLSN